MGAASSVNKGSGDGPIVRENGTTLFQVVIWTPDLAKRTSSGLLEVSAFGIRVLEREDKQVIKAIPMSLIHSWSPESKSIGFLCTNSKLDLYQIELGTTQADQIVYALHTVVSGVLNTRKEKALNESEISDLLSNLNRVSSSSQLSVLKSRLDGRFLNSEKAFLAASCFNDTFDKMEATLYLQSHLIDQNKFSRVLETFKSEEERQNVWHRIYVKLY